ncbi:A-kinase anchor protein 5 [Buceros rhinoceros silvestris]|uniref:A-kinase anchor protein 5 n=1 Tax=Buceros rhinoceros silvestris TaxID=175836 RepID=A0A091GTG0_BUCRH|nr:PREDICTED: A-kinase anchor protein 5 [Buceros rhinoceros silvestris]KFO86439.1 A-kinase anchor protein 5 [Buceros rhinoceros silvestris]
MVKAAKEIQMENSGEVETHSTGATCSPSEEQAEKPSMLCFKTRKKSCKKGTTVKDVCEGALEEQSQCISTDQGEAKVSDQSRSSKGAWAAIKNLTRPRRRQKSSSRKKVPSDSQVEMDAEEGCAQGFPKKRVSAGVKMPCVRFSRGKKKPSPSEAVEKLEGSVQANEVTCILNKASEEPEDLAPTDKPESISPVSVEEDQDTAKESVSSVGKSEPLTEPAPDAEERTECTAQSEITASETAPEILQEGSPAQTTVHVEGEEVASEAPVSKDQPNSTRETTELQEIPHVCEDLPEGDESEKRVNLPEECQTEEPVKDFSQSVVKEDAASVQDCSSHQVTLEANAGTGVSIIITVTEAEDSDNTDSDQAYEPSPVLQRNKQKGNKKSSGSFDLGQKEGPEADGGPQAEENGPGDQGHRTGEQYELLLIETASSLVKAAIQSSIEQLVNEMALEQNKHNSFL